MNTTPNEDQVRYWNDASGPKWVRLQTRLDAQNGPFGARAMDALAPRAGERVLDVGCGCGATALALAERVGPGGRVTGLDVSRPMLGRAGERAAELGEAARNVSFVEGDAQTYALDEGAFDAVFSRFGVMFFSDPTAAFANLRRALAPGGRAAFVCWQPLERNAWMAVPARAAAAHVAMPPRPEPFAPGPFSLADRARIESVLAGAGFAGVRVEPWETTMLIGGGLPLDEATDLALEFGPVFTALRDAPASARPAVREAVREALAPYETPEGVRLPAAVWVVSARRDGGA